MYNTYYMMYIHDRILDVLDSIQYMLTIHWTDDTAIYIILHYKMEKMFTW